MELKEISEKVEVLRREVADVCSQLVQRPSQHPEGKTDGCVTYIKDYFDGLGIETEVYTLEEGKPNIVARIKGKSSSTIFWVGHLDVVPEGKPENWTYPPYSGAIKDGMIYGRGSSDMKGACASAMVAAKVLNEYQPPHNMDFWFTADEEVGGRAGARWLAEKHIFKGEACIIGDGGGSSPGLVNIGVGNKGGLGMRLIARGRTAHGSRPYLGENAIDRLLAVIPYVRRIGDYRLELPPDLAPLVKSSAEFLLRDQTLTEAQRLATKSLYDYPTGPSLNIFRGGVKSNVVPDYAEAQFDVRLTPGCDAGRVKARLEELVAEAGVPGVVVEASASQTVGYYEPPGSAPVASLSEAVRLVTGVKPALTIAPWGTDAVSVKRFLGVPCLIFGPMVESQLHSPDEYVPVENLVTAAKVYATYPYVYGG
jgi:succinyl-diaminopimelate desuccinylase